MKSFPFQTPFSGVTTESSLCGLFLYDPSFATKLAGYPLSKVFKEADKPALYKRIQRAESSGGDTEPRLQNEVEKWILELQQQEGFSNPFPGHSFFEMRPKGCWANFLYGARIRANTTAEPETGWKSFILEIERACDRATVRAEYGFFPQAAQALLDDALMRHFLWPEAVAVIEQATSLDMLLPVRRSVALEVWLSRLALKDVDSSKEDSGSLFSCLLPPEDGSNRNPIAQFFQWLRHAAGIKSMDADDTMLRRWSNGTRRPSRDKLEPLSKTYFKDAQYPPLWSRYEAALELNFLGFEAQTYQAIARDRIAAGEEAAWAPWPRLPFGHETIQTWMRERYSFWLEFHESRLAHLALSAGCGP